MHKFIIAEIQGEYPYKFKNTWGNWVATITGIPISSEHLRKCEMKDDGLFMEGMVNFNMSTSLWDIIGTDRILKEVLNPIVPVEAFGLNFKIWFPEHRNQMEREVIKTLPIIRTLKNPTETVKVDWAHDSGTVYGNFVTNATATATTYFAPVDYYTATPEQFTQEDLNRMYERVKTMRFMADRNAEPDNNE